MKKHQKNNTESPSTKELEAEIAKLRREICLLQRPFYRIQEAFRKINEMLREVIRDDFYYWVHLDWEGGIKVDFIWNQPGGSQIEIENTSLDIILGLLEKIDWDDEIINQFEATERYARSLSEIESPKSPDSVASLSI